MGPTMNPSVVCHKHHGDGDLIVVDLPFGTMNPVESVPRVARDYTCDTEPPFSLNHIMSDPTGSHVFCLGCLVLADPTLHQIPSWYHLWFLGYNSWYLSHFSSWYHLSSKHSPFAPCGEITVFRLRDDFKSSPTWQQDMIAAVAKLSEWAKVYGFF